VEQHFLGEKETGATSANCDGDAPWFSLLSFPFFALPKSNQFSIMARRGFLLTIKIVFPTSVS